jgi:hypothetical protein
MSPKEKEQINAKVDPRIKKMLEIESAKLGMSQTEYLERLIEGTLPGKHDATIEALRKDIQELKKSLENNK